MTLKTIITLMLTVLGPAPTEPLTLPEKARPAWLARDGIIMAGSWEPLLFRVKRDGAAGYTPTPEQRAAYEREHDADMIAKLKDLGVNFIMMHCYKGAGLEAERQSMAEAARYAERYHKAGLRVGVYNYSGALLWEPLFEEVPQARSWILHGPDDRPIPYGSATYRYYWNRNHPDAVAYYRKIVRFAVEQIRADLLHFDNYHVGPGTDEGSVRQFRNDLRGRFTAGQLAAMGAGDLTKVVPPMRGPKDTMLYRAWQDFRCQWMADSYHDMARFARRLRPDILIECNPAGVRDRIRPPVDHGRLLLGGEAFWSEGGDSGLRKGTLHNRIRSYKVARRMGNACFAYTRKPLEWAEAMAFNLDCLGCICWFEYDKLTNYPGKRGKPIDPAVKRYTGFFRRQRGLLAGAQPVADAAVLRSFPSQVFGEPAWPQQTYRAEQALIEHRVPFQIVYQQHLDELDRYRVLILAGCAALSDADAGAIKRFVMQGGRLVTLGPVAMFDEWLRPRSRPALADLPRGRRTKVAEIGDLVPAVRQACEGELTLDIHANEAEQVECDARSSFDGLCVELTEQKDRRLVHLVNYAAPKATGPVSVRVRLPAGRRLESVQLVSPERDGPVSLTGNQQDRRAEFTVPRIHVYEIAVVRHRPSGS